MKTLSKTLFHLLLVIATFSLIACGGYEDAGSSDEAKEETTPAEEPAENPNRGMASAEFGGKNVSIDYGRPELKGRDMLGQASEGMVWRMGMNEATVLQTDADLVFGETTVSAGRYTLWMKKTADGWELHVNEKAEEGMWGRPAPEDGFIASTAMTLGESEDAVERFTVEMSAEDNYGAIVATWANMVLTANFSVSAE